MLVIANWKSHKVSSEVAQWLSSFLGQSDLFLGSTEIVVAPPLPYMSQLGAQVSNQAHVQLAAQDVSQFPSGSYTGAVNARQLKDLGVRYVIVGHSERRQYFHESPLEITLKLQRSLEEGLQPVLCLDADQIETQFESLSPDILASLIIAYEPQAAIGSGQPESPQIVFETFSRIRERYGTSVRCLYGGSISLSTVDQFLTASSADTGLDGFLVGSASLDPSSFADVVRAINLVEPKQ